MRCKHHGLLEAKYIIHVHRKGRSNTFECRICKKEINKRYRDKNKEKKKIYNREWARKNKEKCNSKSKIRWKKYREKYLATRLCKSKEEVINLSDNYIKTILSRYSSLKYSEIPMPLIQLKRESIRLKRMINEKKASISDAVKDDSMD